MSGPKFRFTIVVGFLVVVWWVWSVASAYLLGQRGLDVTHYLATIPQLGAAALAGLGLVWLAMHLAANAQRAKTGFEAEVQDEYGTIFRMGIGKQEPFPMQLSKFLPEVIAPPQWPGLSGLEAELIGFLNGYRHWPADLESGEETLYMRAMARWDLMRGLPGAGPWHRIMALAADLGKIYAYKEIRASSPLSQFWRRDRLRFERRTHEHGGLAAFMLSTLPGFRALALQKPDDTAEVRRALLNALRYMDDPRLLPTNSSPLAREILDYWQRCESLLLARRGQQAAPSEAQIAELKQLVGHHLGIILKDLQPSGTLEEVTEALVLPGKKMLVRSMGLMTSIGQNLPTHVRQRFHLWEGAGVQHPAWPLVVEQFKAMQIWQAGGDHEQPASGREYLLEGATFGPAILLDLAPVTDLHHVTDEITPWPHPWEARLSTEDVKHYLSQQDAQVGTLLEAAF